VESITSEMKKIIVIEAWNWYKQKKDSCIPNWPTEFLLFINWSHI